MERLPLCSRCCAALRRSALRPTAGESPPRRHTPPCRREATHAAVSRGLRLSRKRAKHLVVGHALHAEEACLPDRLRREHLEAVDRRAARGTGGADRRGGGAVAAIDAIEDERPV